VQAALPKNVGMMVSCYGNSNLDNRETMHVQGLSHWAPANIGPYSQCVKVRYFGHNADSIHLDEKNWMIHKQVMFMSIFCLYFLLMQLFLN